MKNTASKPAVPDLNDRLQFLNWNQDDTKALRRVAPFIEDRLGGVLDYFYKTIREHPEIIGVFSSDGVMSSARAKQQAHWGLLLKADFGSQYSEAIRRVGRVHAMIGLDPGRYMSSYYLIIEKLIDAMGEHLMEPQRAGLIPFSKKHDPRVPAFREELRAVLKAAFLDMNIAISVYSDEVLTVAREQVGGAASGPAAASDEGMEQLSAMVEALGRLDFNGAIPEDMPAAHRPLAEQLSKAIRNVSGAVTQVSREAAEMKSAAGQILDQVQTLTRRTEQSAANLQETSSTLAGLSDSVQTTADTSEQTASRVSDARVRTEDSGRLMKDVVAAIHEIRGSSTQIASIVQMIDEIAFQTNLLALNAAVEAARAGESGKGFAVVAGEVRALAQRCLDAATQITALIDESRQKVDGGVQLVERSGEQLVSMVDLFAEIDELVRSIADAGRAQALSLSDVNNSVNQLDRITQENTQMATQTRATADSFMTVMDALHGRVERFKAAEAAPQKPAALKKSA